VVKRLRPRPRLIHGLQDAIATAGYPRRRNPGNRSKEGELTIPVYGRSHLGELCQLPGQFLVR
jgi:hypothetical protein